MTSSPKHVGLNPQAPLFIPSPYPYYIFFLPQFYPLTLYNINNYQQTHLYHAHPSPPPPPPTAAPPQVSAHNQLKNQETVQSHPRRRFGGACNKNRFINKRVEENRGYFNFERDKIGNRNYGESGAAALRVVQTCVVLNRRPKPVMPLTYGENNVGVDANITTVMVRNIPNKLTRNGLLKLLDEHCMSMNKACKDCGDDQNYSAYDFVYLPIDFKTEVNKGYAFVNFTNTEAVKKFHEVYHNKAWDGFKTPKICEIVCAKIQGKDELVKHFGGTTFICRYDEYLPVCFRPPKDGSGKAVEELIVGQRSSQNLTRETKKKGWEGMQWKRGTHSWGTQEDWDRKKGSEKSVCRLALYMI